MRIERPSRLAWPAFFLLLLPALYWWPLLAGRLPDFMDTVTELYPQRIAAARQLHEGTLPLWLPNMFCGMPLAANPQIALWYPPLWLFLLLPSPWTYSFVAFAHYVIGGFGVYTLARKLAAPRPAAIFAGFIFQFGPMLAARIALMPHLFSVVWIPWVLAIVVSGEREAYRQSIWRPARQTLGIALLMSIQFLAGAPQISFYTAIALAIVWIGQSSMESVYTRTMRPAVRTTIQCLYAGGLALLLASIQLRPSIEFLQNCSRQSIPVERLREQALSGSAMWRSIVGFTAPTLEDTDSINAVGIGAFLVIPLAFIGRRRRGIAALLLGVGVAGYALSLSMFVPLWSAALPLFERFHAPRRALILWSVAGPVLAGLGATRLYVFFRVKKYPRLVYTAVLCILALGTVWILPRIERVFTSTERFQPNPQYVEIIGEDRFLALDPSFRYSYDSRREDYGLSMMPDLGCWFDYNDPQGYDPLTPKRYALARDMISQTSGLNIYPSHGVFITDPNSLILKFLNVNYLVGRYDLYDPGRIMPRGRIDREEVAARTELLIDHPRWPLHAYRQTAPKAWAVSEVRVELDPAAGLARAAMATDPYAIAYVEEELDLETVSNPPAATINWPDDRTIDVRLDAPAPEDLLVVISATWMPGWRGGKQTTVANGFLLATVVPSGESAVRLRYQPRSFREGIGLTIVGLLLLGLGWTHSEANKKRKER